MQRIIDDPSRDPGAESDLTDRTPEHEDLRAKVRRLEAQLERYQEHAQRTSRLFLSVTDYADRVRESARRDAQLALRKARARVEKFENVARDLERTEDELLRARAELAHLQALTEVTRGRLSDFLTAGLQALDSEAAAPSDARSTRAGDIRETLRERLPSNSAQASLPTLPTTGERPGL